MGKRTSAFTRAPDHPRRSLAGARVPVLTNTPPADREAQENKMNRAEIIRALNSVGISAKADSWKETLIEMPGGVFYDSADFRLTNVYWQDGIRIESPALAYDGDAEFNTVLWPL